MSKSKKILIIIIILSVIAFIAAGIYLLKGRKIKINKRDYKIEKIEKYNYFVLRENEKFGVMNNNGNIIIDTKFDNVKIPNPSKDIFVCYEGENIKVLNSNNEEILAQYNSVEPIKLKNIASDLTYEKSVLTYKENNKYGIIDFEGNKLTEAIYDEIENLTYREGELVTKKDNKYGVININGYTIIDNLYDEISVDSVSSETDNKEKGYIVENKTQDGIRCGYINYQGELKLPLEYNEITKIDDSEEIYLIARKNGKYGFYKNYENIINFDYQSMEYSNESQMLIIQKGMKCGVSDLKGNIKIPVEYISVELKGNYIYATAQNDRYVYDTEGKKQDIDFDTIITSTENQNYNITIKNENSRNIYGVIDNSGNTIIPEEYLYLEYIYGDYFIACGKSGKLGVIDKNKNQILDFEYDLIQKINNKNIIQTLDSESKTTSIYSSNMEKTAEMKNANIDIKDNYIKIYSNEDLEYLDNNGNNIESTKIFDNKLYAAKENGKWGFKDKAGKFVIEPKYDRTEDLNEYGYAGIKQDGKWGVINENGEIILEPTYEINSDYIEVDFINQYYKSQLGFGEIYYTK